MPFARKKKCLSSQASTEITSIVRKAKQKALLCGRDNGVGRRKRKGHISKKFRSSPNDLKGFQISPSNKLKSSPLSALDFSDCTISFSSNKSHENSKGSCSDIINIGSPKSKCIRFPKTQPPSCTSRSWAGTDTLASSKIVTSFAANPECRDVKIGGSGIPVKTAEITPLPSSNKRPKEKHYRTKYSYSDFEKLERPQCSSNHSTYSSTFTSSPEIFSHGCQASNSTSIPRQKKIRSRNAGSSSVSFFSENSSNDIQTCGTKDVNTNDEKRASLKCVKGSKCFNSLRNTKSCARKSTAKERKSNSVCKISSKFQYNTNRTSSSLKKVPCCEVSGIHEKSKSNCRQRSKHTTSSSKKASVQQPKNKLKQTFQKDSKQLPFSKCSCLVNGPNVLSECLKKQSLGTNFATEEKIESNVGCILYLGLGRPTHPLIYLNLKMQIVDGNIDSSWAKLAASAVQMPKRCPTVSRLLVPIVYEQLENYAMKHLSKNSPVPLASSEHGADTAEDRLFSDQTSRISHELMWDSCKLPYCKEMGVSFLNKVKCNSEHSKFNAHENLSRNVSSANSFEAFSSTLIKEEKDETDMQNSCDDSSVDFNLRLSSDSDCSVDNDSENSRTSNIDSDITSFAGSSKSEILISKEDREKLDHAAIRKVSYKRKGYRKLNRSLIAKAIWEKRKKAMAGIEVKIDPDIGGKNQNEVVDDSHNANQSKSMNIAFIKEELQPNDNESVSPDADCHKPDGTLKLGCNKKMQLRVRRSVICKTAREERQKQNLSQGSKLTSISRKKSAEISDSISSNKGTTNNKLNFSINSNMKTEPPLDNEKLISQKVSHHRKNIIIKEEPLSDTEDLNGLNFPKISAISGFTSLAEPSRKKQKKRTQQKIRRSLLWKAIWEKRRSQTLTQDMKTSDSTSKTADQNTPGNSLDSTLDNELGHSSDIFYQENSASKSYVPMDDESKNINPALRARLQARLRKCQRKMLRKQRQSAIAKATWEKRRKTAAQGVKKVEEFGDPVPQDGESTFTESKSHPEENLSFGMSESKDTSPEVFERDNSQYVCLEKFDILNEGKVTSNSDLSLLLPEISKDNEKDLSLLERPLVLSVKDSGNRLADHSSVFKEKQGASNTFEEFYTVSIKHNSFRDFNSLKDESKDTSANEKQEVAALRSIEVETAKKLHCDFEDSCMAGEKPPQIQQRKKHRVTRQPGMKRAMGVKRLSEIRKRKKERYQAAKKDFPEKTKKIFRTKAAYEKVKKEVEPILNNITDYVCKKEAFDRMEISYDQDYCPPPDGVFPELDTFSDLVEATNIVKWPSATKDRCARELARLNVNVVKIQNRLDDKALFKAPEHCSKENCKFGCICRTFDWKSAKHLERCSREKCIFGCNCETLALPQGLNASKTLTEAPSILSPIMKKLQAESRKCFAVKEFRETIFVSDLKDEGSKIFLKNKQRDRKLPERFKDHFIGVNDKSIPVGGLPFKNFSVPSECNNFNEPEPIQLEGSIKLNRCNKSGEPSKCLEPAKNGKLFKSSMSSCIETSNVKSKESPSCNFSNLKTVRICVEKLREKPRNFYCLEHAARNCICLRQVRSQHRVNVWNKKIPESVYVPITIWQHLESFKITISQKKLKDGTSRTNLNLRKFVKRNKHRSYLTGLLNREWHHLSSPYFAVAKWHSPQFGEFRFQDICHDRLDNFMNYNIALNNLNASYAQPSRTFWSTSNLRELLQASVKVSSESARVLNAALLLTSSSVTDAKSQPPDSVNSDACKNIPQKSEIQDVAPFIHQTDHQGSIISNVCSIALEEFEKFGKLEDGEETIENASLNVRDMLPTKLTCRKKIEVKKNTKVIYPQLNDKISPINKGSPDGIQLTNLEGSSSGGNLGESYTPSWSSILTNLLPLFKARHQWLVFDLRQNFDMVKLCIKLNGQEPVMKCLKRDLFDKLSFDAHLNLKTVRYLLLKSCSSGTSFSVLGVPGLSSMVFFGPFMRNDSLNLVPLQKIPNTCSVRMVPLKEIFVQYKIPRSQTVHDFLLVHGKIKSSVVDMISKAEEAFIYYYFWEPAFDTFNQIPDNVSSHSDEIIENSLEISGHKQNAASSKEPESSSSSGYKKSNLHAEHIPQMSTEEIYRHVSRIQTDHNYYSQHARDKANDLEEHCETANIQEGDTESARHPENHVTKESEFPKNDQVSKAAKRQGVVRVRCSKSYPVVEQISKRNGASPVNPGVAEESNNSVQPDPVDTAPPGFVSKYLISSVKEVGYVDVYASTTSSQLIVNLSYMELSFDNVAQASDWLNNTLGKYVIYFPVDFKPRWSLVEKTYKLPPDWNFFDVQRISKYVYLTEDGPKVANDVEDSKSNSESSTASVMDDFEGDVAANFSDDEVKEASNSPAEIKEGRIITSKNQEHEKISKMAEKKERVSAKLLHVREVKKRKGTSDIEEIKELLESKEVKEISGTDKSDETSEIKASEEDSASGNDVFLDDQTRKKSKVQEHDKLSKMAGKGESRLATLLHVGGTKERKGTSEIKESLERKEVKEISGTEKSDETSEIRTSEGDSVSGNYVLLDDQTGLSTFSCKESVNNRCENIISSENNEREKTSKIGDLQELQDTKKIPETELSNKTFINEDPGNLDHHSRLKITSSDNLENNSNHIEIHSMRIVSNPKRVINEDISEDGGERNIVDESALPLSSSFDQIGTTELPANTDAIIIEQDGTTRPFSDSNIVIQSCENALSTELHSCVDLDNVDTLAKMLNDKLTQEDASQDTSNDTLKSSVTANSEKTYQNSNAVLDEQIRMSSVTSEPVKSTVGYSAPENVTTVIRIVKNESNKKQTRCPVTLKSSDEPNLKIIKKMDSTVVYFESQQNLAAETSNKRQLSVNILRRTKTNQHADCSTSEINDQSHGTKSTCMVGNSNKAMLKETWARLVSGPMKIIVEEAEKNSGVESNHQIISATSKISPVKEPMSCKPLLPKLSLVTVQREVMIDFEKEPYFVTLPSKLDIGSHLEPAAGINPDSTPNQNIPNACKYKKPLKVLKKVPQEKRKSAKVKPLDLDNPAAFFSHSALKRAAVLNQALKKTQQFQMETVLNKKRTKRKRNRKCSKKLNKDCAPSQSEGEVKSVSEDVLLQEPSSQSEGEVKSVDEDVLLQEPSSQSEGEVKSVGEDVLLQERSSQSEGDVKSVSEDVPLQEPSKVQHDDTNLQEAEKASSTTRVQTKYNLRRKRKRNDEKIGEIQEEPVPAEDRGKKRKETEESSVEAVPNVDEQISETKCLDDKSEKERLSRLEKERFRRLELRRLAKKLLMVSIPNVLEADRPGDRSVSTGAILKVAKLAVNRLKVESQMFQIEHNLLRSKSKFLSDKLKSLCTGLHPAPKKTQQGNSTFKLLDKAVSSKASKRGKNKKERTVLPELFISNASSNKVRIGNYANYMKNVTILEDARKSMQDKLEERYAKRHEKLLKHAVDLYAPLEPDSDDEWDSFGSLQLSKNEVA